MLCLSCKKSHRGSGRDETGTWSALAEWRRRHHDVLVDSKSPGTPELPKKARGESKETLESKEMNSNEGCGGLRESDESRIERCQPRAKLCQVGEDG